MTSNCLSGKYEYFNGIEWRSVSEYVSGEKVLVYYPDGFGRLESPLEDSCEVNAVPLYISKDWNVPVACTADAGIVFIEKGKLCRERFADFFRSGENTEKCKIPSSCEMVSNGEKLSIVDIERLCKSICKNKLKYLKGDTRLLTYVSKDKGRVCFSPRIYSVELASRQSLLSKMGFRKVGYIPFYCGSSRVLAENLWTLLHTSNLNVRYYISEFNKEYYMYQPTLLDDGLYSPDDVDLSTNGDIYFGCPMFDEGDIIGRESELFVYSTRDSVKCGFRVSTGMLVVRRAGTMMVVGVDR